MNHLHQQHTRLLAVAPTTPGFGFAVLDTEGTLVDWGCKSVKGDKNRESLKKIEVLIYRYKPSVLVLQNTLTKNSKRSPRIKMLTEQIIFMAKNAPSKSFVAFAGRGAQAIF